MKRKIGFLIALVAMLSMMLVPAGALADPVVLGAVVLDSQVFLDNKDAVTNWGEGPYALTPGDGIGGILGYNASGSEFVWGLEATGLAAGDYALIYYADFSARFTTWGGNNPGAVIDTVTADVLGNISASGSIDLGMDLPCPPDANQFEIDYGTGPDTTGDNYTHVHGAKIWLVPTSVLSAGGVLPVISWPPDDTWLFETDLITYNDTDENSTIISIDVTPTTIDFGNLAAGMTRDMGTITITNSGTATVDVAASVAGDGVFTNGLKLNAAAPSLYGVVLVDDETDDPNVSLEVPSSVGVGTKTGTLTLLATAYAGP